MEMLEIDGSRGEGGGQMVRTTVAMSTVTGIPVHLTRIRENRPTNGLSRQHVAAVNAVAQMTGSEVEGCKIGSGDLFFIHNVDAESAVRDRYLGDLTVPDGVRLVAIRRGNNLIYPKLDTKILQDDSIIVFSSNVRRSELNKLLGSSSVPEV